MGFVKFLTEVQAPVKEEFFSARGGFLHDPVF
jgi:hypothetical protein